MPTAIKERPILFSAPMVRAILAGRKSMTRRVIKQVPTFLHLGRPIMDWPLSGIYLDFEGRFWLDVQTDVDDNSHAELICPYGKRGDRLYVKEAHWAWGRWIANGKTESGRNKFRFEAIGRRITYLAPDDTARRDGSEGWIYRHARYASRSACRIVLEVTDVRVESLQQITDQDCEREGVVDHYACEEPNLESHDPDDCGVHRCNPIADFKRTWDALNADRGYGWASNPPVWVVSFRRLEPNKC